MDDTKRTPASDYAGWTSWVRKVQQPDLRTGGWQVVTSFGGLFLGVGLMALSLGVGYWLTLLLAIPTARRTAHAAGQPQDGASGLVGRGATTAGHVPGGVQGVTARA